MRLAALRDRLENGILAAVPNTDVNGARDARVPNTTNITSEQYFQPLAYNNISEPYVYDDSYVKFRELRVGHAFCPSPGGVRMDAVFAIVGHAHRDVDHFFGERVER